MNPIIAKLHSISLVSKAERIINDFLEKDRNIIYVINPDGSTFTLEAGCTLLTATDYTTERK